MTHSDGGQPPGNIVRRGPLSWGQQAYWAVEQSPSDGPRHGVTFDLRLDVPPGTALPTVIDALDALVRRYESLRTTYRLDELMQVVHEPQPLGPELIRVADVEAAAAAVRDLECRPERRHFALDREFPLRVAVILVGSAPITVHFCCHHIALDSTSLEILRTEFAQLLDSLDKGTAPRLPSVAWHPVDLATYEQSERGQRANEAAMRYLDRQFSSMPNRILPAASTGRQLHEVAMNSPVLAATTWRLGKRLRKPESTVLLAAVAALLGRLSGYERYAMMTTTSNRFTPDTRAIVGSLAQFVTVPVDLSGDPSFPVLVERVHSAGMTAYRHGRFDFVEMIVRHQQWESRRGVSFSPPPCFNYLDRAPKREADADSTTLPTGSARDTRLDSRAIETENDPGGRDKFTVDVRPYGNSTTFRLTCNATMISSDVMATLARDMEAFLAAAAEDPSLPLSTILSRCGTEPLQHGAEWVNVGNCWTNLHEVEEMLCTHSDVAAAAAAVEQGPEGRSALVAYVVAGDPAPTPASLHRFFLESLPTYPSVIAPHRYEFVPELPRRDHELPT